LQQSDLDYIGKNLDIKIKVDENTKHDGAKHRFSLTMTNTGSGTIREDNWSIYFYSFFIVEPDHLPSDDGYEIPNYKVKVDHINGCLFSISPTPEFPDIPANGSHFVEFYAQWWTVTRTDVPPNWYVMATGLKAVNIESTAIGKRFVAEYSTVGQWKRYRADQYNPFTPQDRYRRYDVRNFNIHTKKIIPTPKRITVSDSKYMDITDKDAICTPDVWESCTLLNGKNTSYIH
jgi:hexosaminidase